MMRVILVAAMLLTTASGAALAADPLTLQLKWVTQAQFAGYYVAAAKGFYTAANLAVTIKPGGPHIDPSRVLASGGADVAVDWLPSALEEREKGAPLVNIAQVFQRSGMELTCRKDSNVRTPADFRGKTLGVWFAGNEYPFLSWMRKLGLPTDGSAGGVKVLPQHYDVEPLLRKQADCISTMTYNEYWQLIDAGMRPAQLTVFRYEDQGVATLEDGLYTTEPKLRDTAMLDRLARFVKASMRGWRYAMQHQAEAVKIVLAADATRRQTLQHQTRMMSEVAKLLEAGSNRLGYLDVAAFDRTVDELMSGVSKPLITRKPEGAWTHAVWDKAFGG